MKKAFLVICILCFQFACARDEMPLIPTNGSYAVEYIDDNSNLINIGNMRRKENIEKAKENAIKNNPSSRLQFDRKQIIEQRALDYMYNRNSTLIPVL